ncbi:MAG: NAD(P)-dependent oxidoreductase [Hyphomicrobiaceae bacterium]|nr:NAD(P)-dependent oxidoreductase [Hyphomicrobiaceae bacterium]
MDNPPLVGILGLGPLGLQMAKRLSTHGRRVLAFDPVAERRNGFPASPTMELAPSLFDLGAGASIILSTLTDVPALRVALNGDDERPGIAAALVPGSIIAHFGWGPYADIVRLTGLLGTRGIGMLDVFTCEGVATASSGRMQLFAGGFSDLVDKFAVTVAPLGTVRRIGSSGQATGLAALRGYVRAARLIALSEAMLIGTHAGIDADVLAEAFDGPIGAGPDCCGLAGLSDCSASPHMRIDEIYHHAADAVAFAERVGISGECVSFSRDVLGDALAVIPGDGDESSLLQHFAAIARAEH